MGGLHSLRTLPTTFLILIIACFSILVPAQQQVEYNETTHTITCNRALRVNCASPRPGTNNSMEVHYYGSKDFDISVGVPHSDHERGTFTFLWAQRYDYCNPEDHLWLQFLDSAGKQFLNTGPYCRPTKLDSTAWEQAQQSRDTAVRKFIDELQWEKEGYQFWLATIRCKGAVFKEENGTSTYFRLQLKQPMSYDYARHYFQCPHIFIFPATPKYFSYQWMPQPENKDPTEIIPFSLRTVAPRTTTTTTPTKSTTSITSSTTASTTSVAAGSRYGSGGGTFRSWNEHHMKVGTLSILTVLGSLLLIFSAI